MKGYQEGRKDVYEKDIKAFEENLKVIKSHNDKINALYEDAMKLMATNKELGLQKIQEIIATDNTGIISRLARSGQYKAMGEAIGAVSASLQAAQDKIDKRNDEFALLAKRFQNEKELVGIREAAALARFKEEEKYKAPTLITAPDGTLLRWDAASQTAVPVPGVPAGSTKFGAAGGKASQNEKDRAYNIMSQFELATKDIKNIVGSPKGTVLGTFAGMTGQSGEGLISSLENTFARKLTADDQRILQQNITGLDQNLARVIGGGYANSSAKYLIKAYQEQVARKGDNPIITAVFLARLKQEMDAVADSYQEHPGASTGQKAKIKQLASDIDKSVPFDMDDVLTAARKGRQTIGQDMQKLINVPPSVSISSDAGAPAAAKQTYTRPPNMTDADWAAYKKEVGG
jgi:hypothetical protein